MYSSAYLWTVETLDGTIPIGQSAAEFAARISEELRPVLRLQARDMVVIGKAVADALEGRSMR
jgi:hypothetical protein